MWRGAKTATERGMTNVAFLRTRIEFIDHLFGEGEVSEIWITFPDPQLKTRRAKKRLTSPLFLERYAQLLRPDGWLNLKTDSQAPLRLHERGHPPLRAAVRSLRTRHLRLGLCRRDALGQDGLRDAFSRKGLPITYTRFSLGGRRDFPPFDWEGDEKLEKDNEEERRR